MSIATEIQRLQSAKTAIKSAIENKGITVGDGTIDTYAQKISEISGGGSGDYEQGFEDGKNSVVDLGKYCYNIRFNNLNLFNTKELVVNCNNLLSFNGFYDRANNKGYVENNTVERITINSNSKPIETSYMFRGENNQKEYTVKKITFNCDFSDCTVFSYAFRYMVALEEIDGQPFDFSSATTVTRMWDGCSALKEFRVVPNTISISIAFNNCNNLSTDTIQSIIDGLADLTGGTEQTLTLHKDVGGKLTETQKATITSKNWELVY